MITQEILKELFVYDEKTGIITNRVDRNKSKKGENPGGIDNRGYLTISINGKMMQGHRLAFLYTYGYLPKFIDHKDRNKLNIKINNLRECRQQQNCYNRGPSRNNKCGIKGVYWDSGAKMWRAQLSISGKNTYLGCFWDKQTAAQIVRIERLKHHGNFANHG